MNIFVVVAALVVIVYVAVVVVTFVLMAVRTIERGKKTPDLLALAAVAAAIAFSHFGALFPLEK